MENFLRPRLRLAYFNDLSDLFMPKRSCIYTHGSFTVVKRLEFEFVFARDKTVRRQSNAFFNKMGENISGIDLTLIKYSFTYLYD